ncbi:uncharacterized protein Nnf1a [Drosophila takahashii]|uniref:uncharacterized protein Nnf1a n=1 Tax=Drosophila takahashii TaxID=29030 RepID=UPI001CF8E07D|nr:uncharacterized protein LOC108061505 [Drosophila takahashii]
MLTEDAEAAFKRHEGIVTQVKQAYEETIEKIFGDLSPSDLEACAAIYEEHEDSALDTEDIINRTRCLMTKAVLKLNGCFFDSNDVGNKLTSLEMLKEHFAQYEGKDWHWNFNTTAPEELTRPLRMRYMDFSLNFMEQQLESQEKELEIAMAKSKANRERIHKVQDERLKLSAQLEQQLSQYQEIKPEIIKLEQTINDSYLTTENSINK